MPVPAILLGALPWIRKIIGGLWAFVLKYPLAVACGVLLFALWWTGASYSEARDEWQQREQKLVEQRDAFQTQGKRLSAERDAAVKAIDGARRTVQLQAAELAKRDAEDAKRQRDATAALTRARAAQRDAEAVAQSALKQLQQASRRSPTCAALLNADLRRECGL